MKQAPNKNIARATANIRILWENTHLIIRSVPSDSKPPIVVDVGDGCTLRSRTRKERKKREHDKTNKHRITPANPYRSLEAPSGRYQQRSAMKAAWRPPRGYPEKDPPSRTRRCCCSPSLRLRPPSPPTQQGIESGTSAPSGVSGRTTAGGSRRAWPPGTGMRRSPWAISGREAVPPAASRAHLPRPLPGAHF